MAKKSARVQCAKENSKRLGLVHKGFDKGLFDYFMNLFMSQSGLIKVLDKNVATRILPPNMYHKSFKRVSIFPLAPSWICGHIDRVSQKMNRHGSTRVPIELICFVNWVHPPQVCLGVLSKWMTALPSSNDQGHICT